MEIVRAGDFKDSVEKTVRPHVRTFHNITNGSAVLLLSERVPTYLISFFDDSERVEKTRKPKLIGQSSTRLHIARKRGVLTVNETQLKPDKIFGLRDPDLKFDTVTITTTPATPTIYIGEEVKLTVGGDIRKGHKVTIESIQKLAAVFLDGTNLNGEDLSIILEKLYNDQSPESHE